MEFITTPPQKQTRTRKFTDKIKKTEDHELDRLSWIMWNAKPNYRVLSKGDPLLAVLRESHVFPYTFPTDLWFWLSKSSNQKGKLRGKTQKAIAMVFKSVSSTPTQRAPRCNSLMLPRGIPC